MIDARGHKTESGEILFDEDPRPPERQRQWAVRSGSPVVQRKKGRDGISRIEIELRMDSNKQSVGN